VDETGDAAVPRRPGSDGPPPWRGPLLRFLILVVVVGAGAALLRWGPLARYVDPAELLATLRELARAPWAPLAFLAAYVLLCPLGMPVSPFILAGGLVFGFAWGSLLNIAGTWLGAASTFLAGRLLGKDFIEHLLGGRLKVLEAMVEKHGFWTLVRVRFVPIPYALVNYAAALAGVRPAVFLSATAVGLAPAVAVFTYFAAALYRLASEPGRAGVLGVQFVVALAGLFLLTFLPRLLGGRGKGNEKDAGGGPSIG
jgi:uncharacterized membrane protein YdjX (TVP38/TMEM64 family)